jgi:HSP20 family protein
MGRRDKDDFIRSFIGMHREMERLFHETLQGRPPSFGGEQAWTPSVDVFETEAGYVVRFELPGVNREDIEITFEEGHLTVSGHRHDCCSEVRLVCHQMEIPYGPFKRTIFIPKAVNGEKIVAHCTAGVLEVALPRARTSGSRKVSIEVE